MSKVVAVLAVVFQFDKDESIIHSIGGMVPVEKVVEYPWAVYVVR